MVENEQGGRETYGSAGLDEELADRRTVIHGVEGRDLINAHRGHLQESRHLIHNADAGETMLALTEVQDRHNSGLLVLGGVSLEDLADDSLILWGEFKGNLCIVIGSVAMLLVMIWIPQG